VSAATSILESQGAASPFDGIAAEYDAIFTDSRIGRAQRSAVWAELASAFHRGDRVLEVGCGTGVDARFLAERGVSVVGCDSSREMIRVAEQRASHHFAQFQNASVSFHHCAAEALDQLCRYAPFDGAFSNFGVLNCISDLRRVAQTLASLVKPSARVLLCSMGPCCAWEFIWFACHGDLKRATRRFQRKGTVGTIGAAGQVMVHYPTLQDLQQAFAPEFRLRTVKGIGVFVPPTYTATWVQRFPRTIEIAGLLDRALARCPGIRLLADHILLTLERVNP
jgi:ubiquinone/menaquinone biosynthesis C-methylase UbiE